MEDTQLVSFSKNKVTDSSCCHLLCITQSLFSFFLSFYILTSNYCVRKVMKQYSGSSLNVYFFLLSCQSFAAVVKHSHLVASILHIHLLCIQLTFTHVGSILQR